jgi:Xaa-Pro aminopeptidase
VKENRMSAGTQIQDTRPRRDGPVLPPVEEFRWRVTRLLAAADEHELDELLVYGWPWRCENVRYLTGSGQIERPCLVRLRRDGSVAALVTSRADRASVAAAGWLNATPAAPDARTSTPTAPDTAGSPEAAARPGAVDYEPEFTVAGLRRLLDGVAPAARVGVTHLEYLPFGLRELLDRAAPGVRLVDATRAVDLVRMVKSAWEHARVEYSAVVAQRAWQAMLDSLVPGVREFEVVAAAERALKRDGAEDNFMIIAFGGTEVRSMHPPQDRRIEPGDLVRTELSPQVDGYYAQVCRTAVLGPASARQERAYAAFHEATEAGIAVARPGVTSHDIAKAENDVLRRHGFGEYCTPQHTRVRGHGLGLHLDELAGLQEGDETEIREGATMIVHPNTYATDVGYLVVGDPLVVTAGGARRFASATGTLPSVPLPPAAGSSATGSSATGSSATGSSATGSSATGSPAAQPSTEVSAR